LRDCEKEPWIDPIRRRERRGEERRGQRRQERNWCKEESGIKTQNSCDSVVLGIRFTVFVFLF
jgi:hypothetical protein